jgi:hypothetical protein
MQIMLTSNPSKMESGGRRARAARPWTILVTVVSSPYSVERPCSLVYLMIAY